MSKKIAIIDLGSNSVRLVIFELLKSGSFKLIDEISDIARLSAGMIEGRYLNDVAMHKALNIIKLFKRLCDCYNINKNNIFAVATAAVRKADNKDYFLNIIKKGTGIEFKVLSGEEEALYVYKAVVQTLEANDGLIVDIGGGSTEIIEFKNKKVVNFTSLSIGAVVATEEFLSKGAFNPAHAENLEGYIGQLLQKLKWPIKNKISKIIGVGGTIRNMAKIYKKSIDYPFQAMHNFEMNTESFYELYDYIKKTDVEARRRIKGISDKRADIIAGGMAILYGLCKAANPDRILISGYGLREGILFDYIADNTLININKTEKIVENEKIPSILAKSLENCLDIYGIRRDHAYHVCNLALSLFNQLKMLHNMGEKEERLLYAAAVLHDVGILINYYGHSWHAFYIILNSPLYGLSHREILLTAVIAALHDTDKIKDDWKKIYKMALEPGDESLCLILSAFLKLAESLDRSETGIISNIKCYLEGDTVKIRTYCSADASLELQKANENGEVFMRLFNKQLRII